MDPVGVVSSSRGLDSSSLDRARVVFQEEGKVAAVLSTAAEQN